MGSWSPLSNHQKQLAVEGSSWAAIREGGRRQRSHHAWVVVQSTVLTWGIMPPRASAGVLQIHTIPSMDQHLKGSVEPLLISRGTKLKKELKKKVQNFSFGVDLLKNEYF